MGWFKDREKAEDEFLLRNSDDVRSRSKWWSRVLQDLNLMLNPYHDWFAYGTEDFEGTFDNLADKYLEKGLTDREKEANAFSAEEAQKSRDFTEYMARNKYAIETQSMRDAGVNPAMVYGGGNLVPTASNGAQASSVSPTGGLTDIIPLIMSMVRMPLEMKKLSQDIAESKSREQKNVVEAHGVDLQNMLTEQTWNDLVQKAGLDNDSLRSEIELKKKQAKTEEEKAKLTAAETILTKLDKSQKEELFPLLKHAQELSNAYNEVKNSYEEREIRQSLRESAARVKNLIASALLSDEQRKYAGRMTLGQALAMAIGNEGGIGAVLKPMMEHSPLGGLIEILKSVLGDDEDLLGEGGKTSPTGGSGASGSANGAGSR